MKAYKKAYCMYPWLSNDMMSSYRLYNLSQMTRLQISAVSFPPRESVKLSHNLARFSVKEKCLDNYLVEGMSYLAHENI